MSHSEDQADIQDDSQYGLPTLPLSSILNCLLLSCKYIYCAKVMVSPHKPNSLYIDIYLYVVAAQSVLSDFLHVVMPFVM